MMVKTTTSIVFCLVYFMEPWEADAAGTKAEMRGMTRGTEAERLRCSSADSEIPLRQTIASIKAVIPAEDENIPSSADIHLQFRAERFPPGLSQSHRFVMSAVPDPLWGPRS